MTKTTNKPIYDFVLDNGLGWAHNDLRRYVDDEEIQYVMALYRGKPCAGFLDRSAGILVLHAVRGINGSDTFRFLDCGANRADWIRLDALDGMSFAMSRQSELVRLWKKFVNDETKRMKNHGNKPEKNRATDWEVSFRNGEILLKSGSILYKPTDMSMTPAQFKADLLERRRTLEKYEKEFGKVS